MNLTGVVMRMCVLDNARAEWTCFDGGRLEDSTAVAADFTRATFHNAHLTETSFARGVLREAIFDDAEGDGIDFRGADLASPTFNPIRSHQAHFPGADLPVPTFS